MEIFIETERLLMRELQASDDTGMFELDSDPEVHTFVGRQPVTSIQQSRDVIAFIRKQYVDNGIGRWAVIEKQTNEFVGWSGLKLITELTNGHNHYHDLGYRFKRNHWGKGYATETAKALLDHGFQKMNLSAIYAMANVANKASQHVLNKAGLKQGAIFEHEEEPHYWYSILKNELPE